MEIVDTVAADGLMDMPGDNTTPTATTQGSGQTEAAMQQQTSELGAVSSPMAADPPLAISTSQASGASGPRVPLPECPFTVTENGFMCGVCGKSVGSFAPKDATAHGTTHNRTVKSETINKQAIEYLTDHLHLTAHGVMCSLCHILLPEDTVGSITEHLRTKHKVHKSAQHNALVEEVLGAAEYEDIRALPVHLVLPCVVAGCKSGWSLPDQLAAPGTAARELPKSYGAALVRHVQTHVKGAEVDALVGGQCSLHAFRRGERTWSFVGQPAVQVRVEDIPTRVPSTHRTPSKQQQQQQQQQRDDAMRGVLPDMRECWRTEAGAETVMALTSNSFPPNALTREAREGASSPFRALGYFVAPQFYSHIVGKEDLGMWWSLVHDPCPGGAGVHALVKLAVYYIEVAKSASTTLFLVDPSNAYERHHSEAVPAVAAHPCDERTAGTQRRFLSDLQAASVQAYAKVLARLLSWLNFRAFFEGQDLPFPSGEEEHLLVRGDAGALAAAATRLFKVLRLLEWGGGKGFRLGALGHYLLACALVRAGGGRAGDTTEIPRVTELYLCTYREWGDQTKSLLWVLKGTVMISRYFAVTTENNELVLPLAASASIDMIKHVMAACRVAQDAGGGQQDVALDPMRSRIEGSPTVRIIHHSGVTHMNWDLIRFGVARGHLRVMEVLGGVLSRIGVQPDIIGTITDPLARGRVVFRPQHKAHICHIFQDDVDIGEAVRQVAEDFLKQGDRVAQKGAVEDLAILQELLFWLLPVGCGACMRTSDTRRLRVALGDPGAGGPSNVIFPSSEVDIRVHSTCNKTKWQGIVGQVLNSLSYKIAIWMAVFVLLKDVIGENSAPFVAGRSIWFENFAHPDSKLPCDAFARVSLELLGHTVTIGQYRQVAVRLCRASEGVFEEIVDSVMSEGGFSVKTHQPEAKRGKQTRDTIANIICQSAGG